MIFLDKALKDHYKGCLVPERNVGQLILIGIRKRNEASEGVRGDWLESGEVFFCNFYRRGISQI